MNHRDRVIKALDHEETDRPPFQATFVPEFANRLRKEFGLHPLKTILITGSGMDTILRY